MAPCPTRDCRPGTTHRSRSDPSGDGAARLLLSWSFALGAFVLEHGWQLSLTDGSTAELYPSNDVIVAADAEAVRGEVMRVLTTLRLDLGAPDL